MEKFLHDRKLYEWMERVDTDMAGAAKAEGCDCGGRLHRADYPRKPRGGLKAVVEGWAKRWSWCCEREGCRKRKTPPSVRFLGRKVYVSVVVILVAAMRHGLSGKRVARLGEALGVERRTLERWRQWWTETFAQSGFWRGARGQFLGSVAPDRLPLALVEAFGAGRRDGLEKLLRFLVPITTGSSKMVAAM